MQPGRWHQIFILLIIGLAVMVGGYQLPACHTVNVGGYDAAYVQGFSDPQQSDYASGRRPYLEGSDGRVRWSHARSYLVFPPIGQPATLAIRLRGWRPDSLSAPVVQVFLNGQQLLQTIQTNTSWETYHIPIQGGFFKPSDVVIELRSETALLVNEGREVGVLVDAATYQTTQSAYGFIVPYPFQVAGGVLAMGLLWLLLASTSSPLPPRVAILRVVLIIGCVGGGFLCCYRLSSYPIRGFLLLLNALLLMGLAIRFLPILLPQWFTRYRWLAGAGMIGGIVLWFIAMVIISQDHLTLSVPGVEKDFRVFATRAPELALVFQLDGFYPPGYPFLLWLVHPLTAGNVFLAARLIAAASAAVMLGAAVWLAQTILSDHPLSPSYGQMLVLLILASNPLVVQYALYVGSDMPFAAAVTLSLALLLSTVSQVPGSPVKNRLLVMVGVAGGVAGVAFLIRHPGLVLLPWGVLTCVLVSRRFTFPLLFATGFIFAASPLLVINTLQTGHPLFSHQAKNIWLAVYGHTDWGRWGEVPDTIRLSEIILQDPMRFVENWAQNIRNFSGTGAEDTSEHGRAIQLRLLGWPANWLAIAGGMMWGGGWLLRRRTGARSLLLLFLLLYVMAICVGFILPRFFLPLAPIYAIAAVSAVQWLITRWGQVMQLSDTGIIRAIVVVGIGILLCSNALSGARFVLEHQPDDERAIIRLTLDMMETGEKVLVRVPASVPIAKYSALAHLARTFPDIPDEAAAILNLEHHPEIAYLLRADTEPLPPLPPGMAAKPVGRAGRFALYRLVRKMENCGDCFINPVS